MAMRLYSAVLGKIVTILFASDMSNRARRAFLDVKFNLCVVDCDNHPIIALQPSRFRFIPRCSRHSDSAVGESFIVLDR